MTAPPLPADLATLVAAEVMAGLSAVDLEGRATVTRVIVRVGEPAANFEDVAWQAEIEIDPQASPLPSPPPEILSAVASMPVSSILGINTRNLATLQKVGLETVGELAAADVAAVAPRSRQLPVLAGRARACLHEELPATTEQDARLSDLVSLTTDELAKRLKTGRRSAVRYQQAITRLAGALNQKALGNLSVGDLRKG